SKSNERAAGISGRRSHVVAPAGRLHPKPVLSAGPHLVRDAAAGGPAFRADIVSKQGWNPACRLDDPVGDPPGSEEREGHGCALPWKRTEHVRALAIGRVAA